MSLRSIVAVFPHEQRPQPYRETPLRECAGIIKNDAHRVFYRVNDSRVYPGAMVEETGSCITESATTVSRCDVCNVSQIMAQDVVMWQSGTQDILSE